ncbi:hypothetical protein KSX_14670 [Ktedonospora formicarum]|uniref:Guanylate cyclase domain-containing protein n=1 Tax=Ktedonospora formicarum TaxID=2778364 RepID=A0A8J3HT95_9CHLR|nr:hypothetical protein KSX_14670 [Ktedonospora formicarum]
MPEERKLVSILFADVTGSTALGDTLDPEDVRALMGRYYEHARHIIPRHGGILEKFIGDAVMAIFGLPSAHGDDPERALAAALALREAVANDDILGPSFLLRIGINMGEVMATIDTSNNQFLATGDAVNVAARLEQNANPGEILAGERVYAAANHAFLFEEARLVEVKGKSKPLQVYPLQGQRAAQSRASAISGAQTRLDATSPLTGSCPRRGTPTTCLHHRSCWNREDTPTGGIPGTP